MLNFILRFIACITFLVSQIDSIRCRALTAAQQTIDGAVLVVVGALKANNPFRVLPPATKTSPVWISPSTTILSQHPPPLSLSLGLYFILAFVTISAIIIVKMGALQVGSKTVVNLATSRVIRYCKQIHFLVLVLVALARPAKFKLKDRRSSHRVLRLLPLIFRTRSIVAAAASVPHRYIAICLSSVLRMFVATGYLLLLDLPPANPFELIVIPSIGLDLAAADTPLPGSTCMLHPELPWYNIQQMIETALPGPNSLVDEFKPRPPCRPVNDMGVTHTVHLSDLNFVKRLGSGQFGQVLRVELPNRTKAFAVKKIRKVPVNSPPSGLQTWEFFCAEVDAHVVMKDNAAFPTLHSIFHDKMHFYLVMDVGERSLADTKITSRTAAFCFGIQLVKALHALHERGIVHLDIKPSNLVLTTGNRLLVIDFGIAQRFDMEVPSAEFPRWSLLRRRGGSRFPMLWPSNENPHQLQVAIGTEAYMSPAAASGEPCSYGADVWAFGIVFYEWLSGAFPTFEGTAWVPNRDHRLSTGDLEFFYHLRLQSSTSIRELA
ncbi:kinase-like domain-containing protein [Mycena galopus ATCC 62051]|nr:kinase-like domain-containing protein [Mycena galopus ATCC 62051]